MKTVFGLVMAVSLVPFQQSIGLPGASPGGQSPIIQIEDGCGRGFHRNRFGYCRPNEPVLVCPRGYHLGHDGRCWPNY